MQLKMLNSGFDGRYQVSGSKCEQRVIVKERRRQECLSFRQSDVGATACPDLSGRNLK